MIKEQQRGCHRWRVVIKRKRVEGKGQRSSRGQLPGPVAMVRAWGFILYDGSHREL